MPVARRWPQERQRLQADLLAGRFRFGLQRRITLKDGSEIDLWSPRDALVLKCLAWLGGERLGLSKRCAHLKGHGGARWKLRRAVRVVNQVLGGLGLEKAREKTFIGRLDRGFDFLGYRLSPDGITVAEATWKRFCERTFRLYEQDRREPFGSPRSDAYVRRWWGWARGGLAHSSDGSAGIQRMAARA